jgi:hypothetical protein
MLGWFTPACPLATQEKAWVERRMGWLADRFGLDRLRAAPVILPTDEHFPDPYDGDEASARVSFRRMCGYMGVDPEAVTLELVPDDDMPGAAGLYQMRERSVICVAESQLAQPARLLATYAHELAHELLLKGGHLTDEVVDHELVTDLLPVFLGTGVFIANATVESRSWTVGQMHYHSYSRQGYLTSQTLGYALSLFAYARGEAKPPWAAHLRPDAAVPLKKGLRFLNKTGDTLFGPNVGTGTLPLADRLTHRSPSVRMNALWDLQDTADPPVEFRPAVERLFHDRDPDVRLGAVEMIGHYGPASEGMVSPLANLVVVGTVRERIAAATALGEIGAHPKTAIPALTDTLRDEDPAVIGAAARALARFGPLAESAERPMLEALRKAAAVSDLVLIESVTDALGILCPELPTLIRMTFAGSDPEGMRLALSVVRERSIRVRPS